jgi:hypothetical protein
MRLLIAYAKRQVENGYLSLDDVVIPKPFARRILWVGWTFSPSKGGKVRGLHIVVLLWCTGKLKIPSLFACGDPTSLILQQGGHPVTVQASGLNVEGLPGSLKVAAYPTPSSQSKRITGADPQPAIPVLQQAVTQLSLRLELTVVKACHRPCPEPVEGPGGSWAWAGPGARQAASTPTARPKRISCRIEQRNSMIHYWPLWSQTQDFESRITRMDEFHEHCPAISSQIRAVRPFVTFVFQNPALTIPPLSPILPLLYHSIPICFCKALFPWRES